MGISDALEELYGVEREIVELHIIDGYDLNELVEVSGMTKLEVHQIIKEFNHRLDEMFYDKDEALDRILLNKGEGM